MLGNRLKKEENFFLYLLFFLKVRICVCVSNVAVFFMGISEKNERKLMVKEMVTKLYSKEKEDKCNAQSF